MKSVSRFLLLVIFPITASYGQALFNFPCPDDLSQMEVRCENDIVICFYKVNQKNSPVTLFRQVFLDEFLTPLDSIEYILPAEATLIGYSWGEKVNIYAFHFYERKSDSVRIITTEKGGAIRSTCTLPLQDFSTAFETKSIKPFLLNLKFIAIDSETVTVQPYMSKAKENPGKILRLNLHDGHILWKQEGAPLDKFVVTRTRVAGTYNAQNQVLLVFLDLQTGSIISRAPLASQQSSPEVLALSFFENRLIVTGVERLPWRKQLFLSILDTDGNELHHGLEDTPMLSSGRMRRIGQFYNAGALYTICEGWQLDNTGKAARVAADVVASTIGIPSSIVAAPIDFSITALLVVKTIVANGSTQVLSFPVGPYNYLSRFATNNREGILVSADNFVLYEPDEPDFPVTRFRKSPGELLLFAEHNAIGVRMDGKTIRLRSVDVHRER